MNAYPNAANVYRNGSYACLRFNKKPIIMHRYTSLLSFILMRYGNVEKYWAIRKRNCKTYFRLQN